MYIERLELVGYRRLMLNNINHIVYTPTSPYQLILGTNGSGKSSLVAELSPLPADSSKFAKGGKKQIVILHNGARYVLTSTFKSGNKHSFLRNDEELNPGGTLTVQKEMVLREFGIWGDLHDVLTGKTRFNTMSSQQRRDWISTLSVADYSYALDRFNKLRSAARDRQGVVKHLKNRLTQESANLSMLEDVTGNEERRLQIMDELNAMLSERRPSLGSFKETFDQLEVSLDRIKELNKLILRHYRPMPAGYQFTSLQDVDREISNRTVEIDGLRTLMSKYTEEHSQLEDTARKIAADEMEMPVNLYEEIERLEDSLIKAREREFQFQQIDDAERTLLDTQSVLEGVVNLFKTLPDNEDRHLSKQSVETARANYAQQRRALEGFTNNLVRIQRRLTDMHEAHANECPSCKYVWRPGHSDEEVRKHEAWLVENQQAAELAEAEIKKLERFFEEVEEYTAQCQRFRGFVSSYPRMRQLWDHILENKLLTDRPNEQTTIFYSWLRDVQVLAEIQANEQRLKQLRRIAEQQQLGGSVTVLGRLGKLSHDIQELTGQIVRLNDQRRNLTNYRNDLAKFTDVSQELEKTQANLATQWQNSIDSFRNKIIDETVRQHQVDLAQIQQRLSNYTTLTGIVRDLEGSLSTSTIEQEAYALIIKELSPVDGLIAEQMSGFIGCLVDQMNTVIKSIWTTDFIIQPCGIESGELDYKFPVLVGDGLRSEDIRDVSTAQGEVINFAFVVTLMLYLNLKEHPLYLDELGSGFDEQHRINVMQFVKQLMEVNQHPQLFMISHYVSSWGVFIGAQYLVLDSTNIAVPDGHNQHAILN